MLKIKNKLKNLVSRFSKIDLIYESYKTDFKSPKVLLGKLLIEQKKKYNRLEDWEFQVFSQWGDDGIIQAILNFVKFENETFIEFGVEDYRESNTRFLLLNNNWSGLVIDGAVSKVEQIKSDQIYWTHDLHAHQAFITAENINSIIENEFILKGYSRDVGILSIDIDGNDYWVWKSISSISPQLVIVEYNSFFGADRAITIPYREDFVMNNSNSPFYWGASLKAFFLLAEEKGYGFIGCNSAGNNAYFLRRDKLNEILTPKTVSNGYVNAKFRLKFKDSGEVYLWSDIQDSLRNQKVFDVEKSVVENY